MTKTLAVAASIFAMLACSAACAVDLHQFWENRCQECHGHAGAFARRHLTVVEGKLAGGHHKSDLKQFLGVHEVGVALASDVYEMLLAQAQTQPVFQQKCSGCHETAADFARSSLSVRAGVLVGRSNGLPVAEFLKRHGKLTAEEVPIVLESLTRVLKEVGVPTSK